MAGPYPFLLAWTGLRVATIILAIATAAIYSSDVRNANQTYERYIPDLPPKALIILAVSHNAYIVCVSSFELTIADS
jgi:hypothetical protein